MFTNGNASVKVAWSIASKEASITAKDKSVAMGKTAKLGATVDSGATLTYKSSNAKVAKVNASGTVTPVKAGSATVTITAAANGNYAAASTTVKVTVKAGTQTLKFKKQTKKITYKKVKKTKQTVAITKATGAKTTVTYSISKYNTKKAKTYLTINKKNGKITAKTGTPKGTYKITVTAKAKKTANWKAASKKAVITVKVS